MSKLRDRVTVKEFEGKECILTDLDKTTFSENKGRLGRSNPKEVTGRKLTKENYDVQFIFDKDDDEFLGMLGEPDSELIEETNFAWHREIDESIIEAASGKVYGGVEPHVTEINLPSTQKVAVNFAHGGNSSSPNLGLTPEKIINARTKFKTNEIYPNEDELFLVISPKDIEDLTQFVKNAGNDVWADMVANYEKDPMNKLFQCTVIESNRLTKNTSDIETAIMFSKRRGICVVSDKMRVEVDVLPAQKHARQISVYGEFGAVRRYEEGVVEISCDHSP